MPETIRARRACAHVEGRRASGVMEPTPRAGACGAFLEPDVGYDRKPDEQRGVGGVRLGQFDADREPLRDLDVIAGCVFGG